MTLRRSRLKRGTKKLQTRTPLRRYTPLGRSAQSKAWPVPGQGPEGGAPRRRSRGATHRLPVDVAAIVASRSGGVCEAQLPGCWGRASEKHHRVTRKVGGRHGAARAASDRASNLLHLDVYCHLLLTNEPLRAVTYGFSLKEFQESTQEWVLYRGERMYLDDAGGVHSFELAGA